MAKGRGGEECSKAFLDPHLARNSSLWNWWCIKLYSSAEEPDDQTNKTHHGKKNLRNELKLARSLSVPAAQPLVINATLGYGSITFGTTHIAYMMIIILCCHVHSFQRLKVESTASQMLVKEHLVCTKLNSLQYMCDSVTALELLCSLNSK